MASAWRAQWEKKVKFNFTILIRYFFPAIIVLCIIFIYIRSSAFLSHSFSDRGSKPSEPCSELSHVSDGLSKQWVLAFTCEAPFVLVAGSHAHCMHKWSWVHTWLLFTWNHLLSPPLAAKPEKMGTTVLRDIPNGVFPG